MTKTQENLRKTLLAKIHTHARYKEIKEAQAWSAWLSVRFGIESSAELSIKELCLVLDIFAGNAKDGEFSPDESGRAVVRGALSNAQERAIVQYCEALEWDFTRLSRFIKHQVGFYVLYLNALKKEEASKVLTGLKKVLEQKRSKA